MTNNFKYPKYLPIKESSRSQYWEDPHSIIVMNGGIDNKSAGKGSASLGKQNSIENGFGVVVVVGGPVYTHSLE